MGSIEIPFIERIISIIFENSAAKLTFIEKYERKKQLWFDIKQSS